MIGIIDFSYPFLSCFILQASLLPKENTDSMMRNTIKVERAKKNLTQAELAERIGVSRQAVNSIETGKFIPSTLLALRMAKVFEVLVEQIFQLEDEEII